MSKEDELRDTLDEAVNSLAALGLKSTIADVNAALQRNFPAFLNALSVKPQAA